MIHSPPLCDVAELNLFVNLSIIIYADVYAMLLCSVIMKYYIL